MRARGSHNKVVLVKVWSVLSLSRLQSVLQGGLTTCQNYGDLFPGDKFFLLWLAQGFFSPFLLPAWGSRGHSFQLFDSQREGHNLSLWSIFPSRRVTDESSYAHKRVGEHLVDSEVRCLWKAESLTLPLFSPVSILCNPPHSDRMDSALFHADDQLCCTMT